VTLAHRLHLTDAVIKLPCRAGRSRGRLPRQSPEQGALILQPTRLPLLEAPFEVFDQSVLAPNDRFNVRRHWAVIPTEIDVGSFRLVVRGHVEKEIRR
jgi:hypothetical protein